MRLWQKQRELLEAVRDHQKVIVPAGHDLGKTFLGGCLVLWFFETHDPGIVLTTAPKLASVKRLLWKNVRSLNPGVPLAPAAPQIMDPLSEFHYAVGYTAAGASSAQGVHAEHLLAIFDEAVGIRVDQWEAMDGMVVSPESRWVALLNPTDTSTEAYNRAQDGTWHEVRLSCLDHPNIAAELAGLPPPFPAAVRLSWVEDKIATWTTLIEPKDARATDLEWPPGSGRWYRPGPEFEAKVLGFWPTSAVNSVWAPAVLAVALRDDYEPEPEPAPDQPPEIGCDVAREGDDDTAIHVRRGNVSIHHETHHGWTTDVTAGRLKALCRELAAELGGDARQIAVKIDDDGVGGGVTDQAQDTSSRDAHARYHFVGMKASHRAFDEQRYPNRRSEAWFDVAERAADGMLDLSRLDQQSKTDLRRQLIQPRWRLDNQGRRVIEPKEQTKKRLGRSPDDADALNLAYARLPARLAVTRLFEERGKQALGSWQAQRMLAGERRRYRP